MAGGEWCGAGVFAPVNRPSPLSTLSSLTCLNDGCDLGNRCVQAIKSLVWGGAHKWIWIQWITNGSSLLS